MPNLWDAESKRLKVILFIMVTGFKGWQFVKRPLKSLFG